MEASASCAATAQDVLARTLWGEARYDGRSGMAAVAAVIMNRVALAREHDGRHWWGSDPATVCRVPGQFRAWNPGSRDRAQIGLVDGSDPDFRLALEVASQALDGPFWDPTFGATHYRDLSTAWPYAWGPPRQPLAVVGRRGFYRFAED